MSCVRVCEREEREIYIFIYTECLGVVDEVVVSELCVGGDEDVATELRVEGEEHLGELWVEEAGGALEFGRALAVSAMLG